MENVQCMVSSAQTSYQHAPLLPGKDSSTRKEHVHVREVDGNWRWGWDDGMNDEVWYHDPDRNGNNLNGYVNANEVLSAEVAKGQLHYLSLPSRSGSRWWRLLGLSHRA